MAESSAKRGNWSLQTHDGPCSNCRVRKIKCGREKPECTICKQAQVECVYTPPPKRVNHVKVLCESFDEVNDRLNMVQAQLSALTSMLEASMAMGTGSRNSPADDPSVNAKPDHQRRASRPNLLNRDAGDRIVPGGFVIREERTLNERYYGPWTLDHECRNFCHNTLSSNNLVVPSLLQKFQRALESTQVDLPSPRTQHGQNSERLLPKVFLSVMVEHFVNQADFCTDIFLRTSLDAAVDRIYSDSSDPLHEAWAVCLDLIFLFVLGAEQPLRAADHTQPLFDAVDSAINKQQLFMAPRLIAVQALALLSLISTSYYPENISDVLFAQACHLATMMGLHCHDSIAPGQADPDLSLDEIFERRKLFRSLYIRERFYATARGTLRRLPRYLLDTNSRASPRTMSQDESHAPLTSGIDRSPLETTTRLETESLFTLAMIQDELHAAIFQASPPETRVLEQRKALSSIRPRLVAFAQSHRLPYLERPQTFQDLSLHLAYLGTRIRAYETDDEHQVLDDARLSCLLVMSACSDDKELDAAVADKLDRLLRRMAHRNWCTDNSTALPGSLGDSSKPSVGGPNTGPNSPKAPNKRVWPFGSETLASPDTQILRNQRVLELMPTSAIFVLARSILRVRGDTASAHRSSAPSGLDLTANESSDDDLFGSADRDFTVLCGLSRILENSFGVSSETQSSYSSKFLRVTQTLISFLREAVNVPDQQSSPPSETRQETLDYSTHTEMAHDDMLNLSTSWESPQVSSSMSFPFSPSFDLSTMNVSTVLDSLYDFDFSQQFENVGGFMSTAQHLPDAEVLRSLTGQEKGRKRLRLDCHELEGSMMTTWPQRNRATMARGSV